MRLSSRLSILKKITTLILNLFVETKQFETFKDYTKINTRYRFGIWKFKPVWFTYVRPKYTEVRTETKITTMIINNSSFIKTEFFENDEKLWETPWTKISKDVPVA